MSDVRNIHMVQSSRKGIDYVFHLAAVTSPPEFENPLGEGYGVNVQGTYNVLAASAASGVRRVILASSSSIYGSDTETMREDYLPSTYTNLHPLSKRINEMTANIFQEYSLETVSLRYFNTYGVDENSKGAYSSVIWKFIESIRNGKAPVIYGDGKQSRDFVYVKDAAKASVMAMKKGKSGEIYNIGTGVTTDFNKIFSMVKAVTGFRGEARHVPNPLKNYQYFTQAEVSKAKRDLNFTHEYNIAKGVTEIQESFSGEK